MSSASLLACSVCGSTFFHIWLLDSDSVFVCSICKAQSEYSANRERFVSALQKLDGAK